MPVFRLLPLRVQGISGFMLYGTCWDPTFKGPFSDRVKPSGIPLSQTQQREALL